MVTATATTTRRLPAEEAAQDLDAAWEAYTACQWGLAEAQKRGDRQAMEIARKRWRVACEALARAEEAEARPVSRR